jgi:hypothetical protein
LTPQVVSRMFYNIFEYGTQRLNKKTLNATLSGKKLLAKIVNGVKQPTYVDSPLSTTKTITQRNKCVLMYELYIETLSQAL